MRLTFCGVRGSTPSPGPEFVRHGGNTSCVALSLDGDDAPTLVLDGGTGLQRLTRVLDGQPFQGAILLGHLHWDHTHGLPFFAAGDRPGSRVEVFVPSQGDDAEEVLARAFSPPHFPIRPSQLEGDWTFTMLEPGERRVGGFDVLALDIPHSGGRTFGFRVSDGRATVAYLSDHSPIGIGPGPDGLGEYHEAALRLAAGADVLVHDAQITAGEFAAKARYGHSAVEYALGLAGKAGARRLVLFHHDPGRTDDQLDALVAGLAGAGLPVVAAAEGTTLTLPED
ncbi:MAG TPA: MBL fold metallo-hydrolase [Acidimicrobiales bacterium]|nr:MBL fold metallo-hydrolase [Acidimicrobiales bacterium]